MHVPKYRHHKARDLAKVTIDGREIYLGKYGSAESHRKYQREISRWLAARGEAPLIASVTLESLVLAYWQHAEAYYVKGGKPTGHLATVRRAMGWLRSEGQTLVSEFGPRRLVAMRERMVDEGLSRRYINEIVGSIKRCFRWGVAQEFVASEVYGALATVQGLAKGRTEAAEVPQKKAVDPGIVKQTLPHLTELVRDTVRFILATGCRPGEAVQLRPREIDRRKDVWIYRPESHKTEHHEKARVIYVGPTAQAILRLRLFVGADRRCFPIRRDSLATAISRACKAHHIPHWSPVQLRKRRGTDVRATYGLDAAQVILGHAHANVTEIYAETAEGLGARIALETG